MNVLDPHAAQMADQTRTLRDVAQHRLRRTTTVGEALYHQATAKAAALAIRAEFPAATYLELEPSDQEGVDFEPGAILDAAGTPIAADRHSAPWDAVVAAHYGPLTDLPSDFTYDVETREALPPYPWLIASSDRVDRLDLRAAAELDLSDAIAAAFPEPIPPTEELGALATDGVVVPAALIDTGTRHHPSLPEWPEDLPVSDVAGRRATDGETRLTVNVGGAELLTVAGVWTGEAYTEDVEWRGASNLTDSQRDEVEAWARQVWIRLTDALDNVVDHAITATIAPTIERVTTDHPSPSAALLGDLSAQSVAGPASPTPVREGPPQPGGPASGTPRFTHPAFDSVTFTAVAYHQGWNGWAAPVVDRATLEALLGHLDPQWLRGRIDSDDVLRLEHLENGTLTDRDAVAPNLDGTYDLGLLGWTFELADEPSTEPGSQAAPSPVMLDVGPTTAPDAELGW
ncbi:hypothetical protein MWU57_08135 [Isoptericola sp. S6320L]|uniref:hypothetical protein n=1 Tax=Isoptericola sp. S6320L TaxID=2926411 RepID=UPI001FF192B1|nr:hypothetical protein [Isoptericola sp. S6320L]MCK0117003.1 hypothetical protein [Isoptericola sp. S6320L]